MKKISVLIILMIVSTVLTSCGPREESAEKESVPKQEEKEKSNTQSKKTEDTDAQEHRVTRHIPSNLET